MSSQRLVRARLLGEDVERRLAGAPRVGDEQRGDRGVEVAALGLAEALGLLAIGADAVGPGRLERRRVLRGRTGGRCRRLRRRGRACLLRPRRLRRGVAAAPLPAGRSGAVIGPPLVPPAPCRRAAAARSAGVSTSGIEPATATSWTSSGCAASSGPSPRSPSSACRERPRGAPHEHRVRGAVAARSAAGRWAARGGGGGRRPPRSTSGRSPGWSPSTTRTASTVGSSAAASSPTRSELASPSCGRSLTRRRSPRQAIAASIAAASAPSTTTTSSIPAAASASRGCWRSGRPSSGASCLGDPNRVAAPAARTRPVTRMVRPARRPPPRARARAPASGGPSRPAAPRRPRP